MESCGPRPDARQAAPSTPSQTSRSCGSSSSKATCAPPAPASTPSCCDGGSCTPPAPSSGADCCPPRQGPAANGTATEDVTHYDVSEYYGKRVQSQGDLQTSACLIQGGLTAEERKLLENVHDEILSKFYGCGSPIPPLLEGLTVLDLGCGTGRDVYLAAQLVGEQGSVIGIDMTDEQLDVARKHEGWHFERFGFAKSNVSFRKGFIEDLKAAGVADSSVDVVISNCVINLAPDKAPVVAEIARVLKPGGELYFSDVFADRRIPEHLRKDKVVTYKGGIPHSEEAFALDGARVFPVELPVPVDSATAATIKASRYGRFFEVPPTVDHLGLFKRWPRLPPSTAGACDFSTACTSGPKKSCC